MFDPVRASRVSVVLRVELLETLGADKYGWELVKLHQVLKNASGRTFEEPFRVAHYSWKQGVPPGISTIYLEPYAGTDTSVWRLLDADGAVGVSHTTAAADCADGAACFALGAAHFEAGKPKPGTTATQLHSATRHFEAACNAGEMRGCNAAGNMFRRGWGVKKDLVQARNYLQRACAPDYPEACHNLHRVREELGVSGPE